MKWKEVRMRYPNQWVLVEALKANSFNSKREIQDMAVISEYGDSTKAWGAYKSLHLSDPLRELYIFHTSNEQIEVIEDKFTGIRRRNA